MNPRPSPSSSSESDVPEPRTPKGAEVTWSTLVNDAVATGMTLEDAIDHITTMAVAAHRMQAAVEADPIQTSGETQPIESESAATVASKMNDRAEPFTQEAA